MARKIFTGVKAIFRPITHIPKVVRILFVSRGEGEFSIAESKSFSIIPHDEGANQCPTGALHEGSQAPDQRDKGAATAQEEHGHQLGKNSSMRQNKMPNKRPNKKPRDVIEMPTEQECP